MEQSENESLGLFPIDFALGSCKETIGLKNHKIVRQQIKKTDEDQSSNDLPTANDYFRAGHTLNYYPDKDQILVFGGYNGPHELYVLQNASNLEKQTSSSPTWEKVILDCKGRSGHISFILDHKLHIFGGYNDFGEVFQDMFTIDLQSGNYETENVQYKSFSNFNLERRWHCAHYFEHNLLVHGGWNRSGALGDTLIYNVETQKWDSPKFEGTAPSPRRWHSLTPMINNPQQLFIYGGYNGSPANPLKDFFLLDLEKQKWIQPSTKGKIPGPRNRHTFTPLNGNTTKEYVMLGGEEGEHRTNRKVYILHTDDMSWSCYENGALYAAMRASHRVDFMSTYGMVIGGGVVADYIEPFYYLDTRMLK